MFDHFPNTTIAWLLPTLSLASLLIWRKLTKRELPLPPGPKGYQLIGNVFDMPQGDSSSVPPIYAEWSKVSGGFSADCVTTNSCLPSCRNMVRISWNNSQMWYDLKYMSRTGDVIYLSVL